MKSLQNFPLDSNKSLLSGVVDKHYNGILMAHYELYRKVSQLEGCVVKCGVIAGEGLARFAILAKMMAVKTLQNLVAFEKKPGTPILNDTIEIPVSFNHYAGEAGKLQEESIQNQPQDDFNRIIDFVPGMISDAIPNYLIENPEMKIAYLSIDLDEYDPTLTTLQYFYPRVVHGGIVVFDNYYKKEEEYNAVNDYFQHIEHKIYNFSVNKGPDYLLRA